jgi:lysozyme
MNFEKAYDAGARFTFIKASQGLWVDEDFLYNWKAAQGIMHRGAYHYLDASASGKAQADFFLGIIHQDMGELPAVIDYEYRSKPKSVMLPIFYDFVATIMADGFFPMIYTSPYYWQDWGDTDAFWRKFLLWIANYEVSAPSVPKPWTDWTFWQKTSRGDGHLFGAESAYIDLNDYNGDWEEFKVNFGEVSEDDPPLDDYWDGYNDVLDELQDVVEGIRIC